MMCSMSCVETSRDIQQQHSSSKGSKSPSTSASTKLGKRRRSKRQFNLNLENFEDEQEVPEDCAYVLTSPTSLEACKRLGVKVRTSLANSVTHQTPTLALCCLFCFWVGTYERTYRRTNTLLLETNEHLFGSGLVDQFMHAFIHAIP